jgi:hypothetical protein
MATINIENKMMILVVTINLLFLLGVERSLSSIGEQNFKDKTKLLKPSGANMLPHPIVKALASRGCLIPQPPGETRSANAIKGSFKAPGQEDWAVVCLQGKRSSILSFLERLSKFDIGAFSESGRRSRRWNRLLETYSNCRQEIYF